MNNYPLAQMRQFINEAFSDEEIELLCFDHFPEVYNNFTVGFTKIQKILKLLSYCQSREHIPELIIKLDEARPNVFARRFPDLLKSVQLDNLIPEIPDEDLAEEVGFLDALDSIEDRFNTFTESVDRMTAAVNEVNTRMSQGTEDLKALQGSQNSTNRRQAKRIIDRTAEDLELYAKRTEAEIPIFAQAFGKGMEAITQATTLLDDFPASRNEQIASVLSALQQLEGSIDSADSPTMSFRNSIAQLPRITSRLNRAKRHAVAVLDSLLMEFAKAKTAERDTKRLVNGLLLQ